MDDKINIILVNIINEALYFPSFFSSALPFFFLSLCSFPYSIKWKIYEFTDALPFYFMFTYVFLHKENKNILVQLVPLAYKVFIQ